MKNSRHILDAQRRLCIIFTAFRKILKLFPIPVRSKLTRTFLRLSYKKQRLDHFSNNQVIFGAITLQINIHDYGILFQI